MTATTPYGIFLTWTLPRVIMESRAWRVMSRIFKVTLKPLNTSLTFFIGFLYGAAFLLSILSLIGKALGWWSTGQFLLYLLIAAIPVFIAGIIVWLEETYKKSRGTATSILREHLPWDVTEEELKNWVDAPVPFMRKTLLAQAGVTWENLDSPATRLLTEEDLLIMAALLMQ